MVWMNVKVGRSVCVYARACVCVRVCKWQFNNNKKCVMMHGDGRGEDVGGRDE